MSPRILGVFCAALIVVIAARMENNRIATLPKVLNYAKGNGRELCRNAYSAENCIDEFLNFLVDEKFSDAFNVGIFDYMNKLESIDSGMINSDVATNKKRTDASITNTGCDCQVQNTYIDLGQYHFPRYLVSAVCQEAEEKRPHQRKCWRGTNCKPVEYKVRVLTGRSASDKLEQDSLVPDVLRQNWKFITVTVAVGCFCSF